MNVVYLALFSHICLLVPLDCMTFLSTCKNETCNVPSVLLCFNRINTNSATMLRWNTLDRLITTHRLLPQSPHWRNASISTSTDIEIAQEAHMNNCRTSLTINFSCEEVMIDGLQRKLWRLGSFKVHGLDRRQKCWL